MITKECLFMDAYPEYPNKLRFLKSVLLKAATEHRDPAILERLTHDHDYFLLLKTVVSSFSFCLGYISDLLSKPENRLTSLRGKLKVLIERCVAECYGLGKKTITEARVREWKMGRLYIYPGREPVSLFPFIITNLPHCVAG